MNEKILMAEACKIAGVSKRTLFRLLKKGPGVFPTPHSKKNQTHVFDKQEVVEWASRNNPKAIDGCILRKYHIAKIIGSSRGNVTLISRCSHFPKPVIDRKAMHCYALDDVVAWFDQYRPHLNFRSLYQHYLESGMSLG